MESVIPEFARGKSKAGPRGDMVWLFDWMVGQIVDALKRTGKFENTLIVVTSDNGALPGDRTQDADGKWNWHTYGHKSSGNFRGYKAHIWEGGHREPLIACWPGHIKGNSVSNDLFGFTDFITTFASLVGETLPDGAAEDGLDMSPILLGRDTGEPIRRSIIHHSCTGVFSIRQDEWKLIYETQGSGGWAPPWGGPPESGSKGQLYNLQDDPAEQRDLFDQRPDLVDSLTRLLLDQRASRS